MSGGCFSEVYLYCNKSCHSVKIMKQCNHCLSSPSLLKRGNFPMKIQHGALRSKYLCKILNIQNSIYITTCIMYRKCVFWERRNGFLPSLPVLMMKKLEKLGGGCGMWWHIFNLLVLKLCSSTELFFQLLAVQILFFEIIAWELENRPLNIGRYFRKPLLHEQFLCFKEVSVLVSEIPCSVEICLCKLYSQIRKGSLYLLCLCSWFVR